ncbi:MAG: hypothetical protein ABI432_14185 [Flavobacteriales bacterium]
MDLETASIDTTVLISDSLLFTIMAIGDASATSSGYYLMSFDRLRNIPMDMVHVCDHPDVDQSRKRYDRTDYSVDREQRVWAITYDCRIRKGNHRYRELVEMSATGRRIWTLAKDGQIQGGEWIAEE